VALSDNVDPSLVLNMDETGCSYRPDKGKSIKCVIHKESDVSPFKREKSDYRSISFVSTITLSGKALPPLIISSRKKIDNETRKIRYFNKFKYYYSKTGFMNQEIMMFWITNCLDPYIQKRRQKLGNSLAPCILIMDNMSAHITNDVMDAFNNIPNFKLIFLPPHSSHFLQPSDVCYFGIFKKKYKEKRISNPSDSFEDKLENIFWALYYASNNQTIFESFSKVGIIIDFSDAKKVSSILNQEKVKILISQGIDD